MKRPATHTAIIFAVLVLGAESVRGAGFLIYEAGAKALGMGGAMTAQADDPSAIFFNPAGLTQLGGTQVYAGFSLIFTGLEFAGVDPDPGFGTFEETGNQLFTPINAYVTHALNDKISLGLGLFNPFGLGQRWQSRETYSGRHISDEVSLQTYFVNPTLAWKLSDKLSLGFGIQFVFGNVKLHRFIQQWDPNDGGFLDIGQLTLEGDNTVDVGGNAGALYTPREDIAIGLSIRSGLESEFDGDARFGQILTGDPAVDDAVATIFPPSQGARTKVHFPWILSVGGAYRGVDQWVFEVDLSYVAWSSFDKLPFLFDDPTLNTERVQDYDNTLTIRMGAAYDVTPNVDARFGYYYDPTPQPKKSMGPILADMNRHGLSFGMGYRMGPWTLDGFLLVLLTDNRDTAGESTDGYNGEYASFAHIYGLNVGYEF